MTARHDRRLDAESVAGHALLKFHREEPILAARDNVDRNRGPRRVRLHVVEALIQLRGGARPHLIDQALGNVVHEIGVQIKLDAVAVADCRSGPGLL